jgi:hypothetical protein
MNMHQFIPVPALAAKPAHGGYPTTTQVEAMYDIHVRRISTALWCPELPLATAVKAAKLALAGNFDPDYVLQKAKESPSVFLWQMFVWSDDKDNGHAFWSDAARALEEAGR